MSKQPYKYRFVLICVFLIAAIVAVYWRVYNYDFVRYDDGKYVTANTNIQSGLNGKSFSWAFTTGYFGNWNPLTWLSYMLDWQLFGSNPGGFHLTNLIFHIINTLLLFLVLKRMTGVLWQSAFVAALFALHPLHVEAVAWVSGRKDVLSTFFWLLTMAVYMWYVKQPRVYRYLLVLLFFMMGIMAKPMLVTLPFVFLLLDYWPFDRIKRVDWKTISQLILEKIPFIILAVVFSVIAFFTQRNAGAITEFNDFGLRFRLYNALISYVKYMEKMFWPSRLSVYYPHPGENVSILYALISAVLLLAITIFVLRLAKNHRYLFTGWFWYLGTLLPVIGLVQVGPHAMADRYSYITLTGLFIIIAWGLPELLGKWVSASPQRKIVLWEFSLIVIFALTVCAYIQTQYWKNSMSLFEHSLRVTENNYLMIDNYASILVEQGRLDEAIGWCKESLRINPDSAVGHNNLGGALLQAGRVRQAIDCFRSAIKCNPDFLQANLNLADSLEKQGNFEEAVSYYKQAIRIAPDNAQAFLGLAITLTKLQKFDQAIEPFDKAIKLEPANISARGYRGMALAAIGKIDEAIEDIRFVLNARPDDVQMHRNLGIFLERKGDIAGAIESYRAALRIDPDNENLRQLLEDDLKKQESTAGK